jgi:hypothetical protein
VVRRRLEGICAASDLPADAEALERTVKQLRPRLLILDLFVRLHRMDENASGKVAIAWSSRLDNALIRASSVVPVPSRLQHAGTGNYLK